MKFGDLEVVTNHQFPPIPARRYGWVAYIDGCEERKDWYGYGPTELDALVELRNALIDDGTLDGPAYYVEDMP